MKNRALLSRVTPTNSYLPEFRRRLSHLAEINCYAELSSAVTFEWKT